MKKLPIGIQDFKVLREDDYLYIDKTKDLYKLMDYGKYLFLARPRRFGKSLMLNTLKEIFEGNKGLFKGLWIEDKIAWKSHPVIHIDFTTLNYHKNSLEIELQSLLLRIAKKFDITTQANSAKNIFVDILNGLSEKGQKAVLLVDEYDAPLTDVLESEEKVKERIEILTSFFRLIKSMDRNFHFVLLTGISKYGKASFFSTLNNLEDISLIDAFSTTCGYTQAELTQNFKANISETAKHRKISKKALLEGVRYWYNGYSWNGKNKVYNPFSILLFFKQKVFRNFWYDTGTPTFLLKKIKDAQLPAHQLEWLRAADASISQSDVQNIDVISLLFQSGYLTIKAVLDSDITGIRYDLGFPNNEVRLSMNQFLLSEYVEKNTSLAYVTIVDQINQSLLEKDWKQFFQTLKSVFSSISYQNFRTEEDYFHSILHIILTLTGLLVIPEKNNNIGRADNILIGKKDIFIFEYKLDQSAKKAIQQIYKKQYAESLLLQKKTINVIGINFSSKIKNIDDWQVELYKSTS